MKYALINGVIYTGTTVLYGHAVIVENDRIVAVVREEDVPADLSSVDLQGHNLTAGFIDLQLNGCGGVMFNGDISVKTLEIMQQTNLRSGTTSYLPTFITATDEGMKSAVKIMREYLAQYRNQALGLHLEGPYISLAKKGVHQAEFVREISPEMYDFLTENADVIRIMTIAPENATARFIADFVEKGIRVAVGHSDASYRQTKQAFARGATLATHLHNAMSPVKSGREMGVVGAVLEEDKVYAGIIADGLHVEFGNISIAKRCKGKKLYLVTDATAAAGSDIARFDFVGTTVYVRDGKCFDGNGTLGGSSITMIESVGNLVKEVGIPLDEALRMANLYPAEAVGVADFLGSVEAGKIANLTVFSHDFRVLASAVNGKWTEFSPHLKFTF